MTRTWLAATTALALTAGVAAAQTTTSTTTYQSDAPVITPAPQIIAPAPSVTETTTQRTINSDGVETNHSKTVTSGTTMSPYGDTTTTRRTTETTTIR